MTLAAEAATAPPGLRVLFQDRNVESASGEMGCSDDPADPSTDDHHGFGFIVYRAVARRSAETEGPPLVN